MAGADDPGGSAPALIAQARVSHQRTVGGHGYCRAGCGDWPCLTARLADALENLANVAVHAQAAYEDLVQRSNAALAQASADEAVERARAEQAERERDEARSTYRAKIRFDNQVMHDEQRKYAALARELGAARKTLDELNNLEWGVDGQECRFCFGIPPDEDPDEGHADNCPLAAALAAPARAEGEEV